MQFRILFCMMRLGIQKESFYPEYTSLMQFVDLSISLTLDGDGKQNCTATCLSENSAIYLMLQKSYKCSFSCVLSSYFSKAEPSHNNALGGSTSLRKGHPISIAFFEGAFKAWQLSENKLLLRKLHMI